MADYTFQSVETCIPCGAQVPKEEAIEFKLYIGGKKVRRHFCQRCFSELVFPHLLTEEEKQSISDSLASVLGREATPLGRAREEN
jgi:hypothetical protein